MRERYLVTVVVEIKYSAFTQYILGIALDCCLKESVSVYNGKVYWYNKYSNVERKSGT